MASNFYTQGSPIFVIDSRSQSSTGKGAVIYLGHSPFHAGNIALGLNLQTGHVSLQYHVVFEDEFSTDPYIQSSEPLPNWIDIVQNHTECATEESFNMLSSWY
eukprot:3045508-Ditylum_brightwellii.AAC.1